MAVSDRGLLVKVRPTLTTVTQNAINLLRENEPSDGYYLAFSGGKDSIVCKELTRLAGVKVECRYNNVTIDPPELVRFIKEHHSDVLWNQPRHGNMMYRVATAPKVPPTRNGRWCCSEYKELGGKGRVKIFGVRAQESRTRKILWNEISRDLSGDKVICPIVHWVKEEVWAFIHQHNLPYCKLYDEGWERLGCVGCPLGSEKNQTREFERWPNYERNWKRAIIASWEKWKDVPNTKTGKPRFHAKFSTGEEFYSWWRHARPRERDVIRDDCQSGLLWVNDDEGVSDAGNNRRS